ncbi:hypothetical protein ACP70R_022042 [Stipagrostis hirtigluma subsp. patula]
MAKEIRRRRAGGNIHDIADDLLELVLLHIGSPVCLVRAAATCKLWRRVIGGAGFLRRYRSLRPPDVLGHYHVASTGLTVFVPSPAPPGEAAAVDDICGRVSLGFPSHLTCHEGNLALNDSRGGLLAYVRGRCSVIVCDPWKEESKEFYPPYPDADCYSYCLAAFLLDADADMSSFRVLCVRLLHVYHHNDSQTVEAYVFSARDGGCLLLGSTAIGDVIRGADVLTTRFVFVGRAGGTLCWSTCKGANAMLLLDESSGEFSSFTLPGLADMETINPEAYDRRNLRFVGVDAGFVRLVRVAWDDLEVLQYVRGSGTCVVERRVGLSQLANLQARPGRRWTFCDTALAAGPARFGLAAVDGRMFMFIIDTANMKLECTEERSLYSLRVFPYELPWPRTIRACM